MFLIAPGVAETEQLAVQGRDLGLQFVVEAFQALREAAQLLGIDNGLRHAASSDGNRFSVTDAAIGVNRPARSAKRGRPLQNGADRLCFALWAVAEISL